MYVNQDTLDTNRQYAYLRHCDGEMALIVANFGDNEVNAAVRIPQHALDCAQIPHGKYTCHDLMDNETTVVNLDDDITIPVHLAPNSAGIYVISHKKNEP